MPVTYVRSTAVIAGVAAVEEAEALLDFLRRRKRPRVDLAEAEHVHTAVLQVLLAIRPPLAAPPADPFLAEVLGLAPTAAPTAARAA